MKHIGSYFPDTFKRSVKRVISELADRDDYECEEVTADCIRCGGEDKTFRYKFHGDTSWIINQKKIPCTTCQDKDLINQTRNEHLVKVKEIIIERYWFIPKDLENAGFKNYEKTNSITKKAADTCIEYVKNFKENYPDFKENLLMLGSPGGGKTHLSAAIARTLRLAGFKVGFLTVGKLLAMIKETYKKGSERSENDILNDLGKFDLLVLDDLGSEQSSKDEFSWTRAKLFEIVDKRNGKPTIYTTNFDDLNIGDVVGPRVHSRLYTNTRCIDMFTEDYRKRLRIE